MAMPTVAEWAWLFLNFERPFLPPPVFLAKPGKFALSYLKIREPTRSWSTINPKIFPGLNPIHRFPNSRPTLVQIPENVEFCLMLVFLREIDAQTSCRSRERSATICLTKQSLPSNQPTHFNGPCMLDAQQS